MVRRASCMDGIGLNMIGGHPTDFINMADRQENTAVKRNAHVRDLRKRGKNKGKLYTKECGLNQNTKYKKTPENIR